nr:uncharacterized protein LOC109781868 [Aegilops tauschii subsp. strangulata]
MLEELSARELLFPGPWMAIGDFNMILNVADKNNSLLDRRIMGKFKRFVDDNTLKELFLHGRRFTWSNERERPTLTKIDRVLVSVDWELAYPECLLQALSTNASDHCPLFLSLEDQVQPRKRFCFELFWVKLEGFLEAVQEGWICDESISDPFVRLDVLLRSCANKHLTAWGQRRVGHIDMQIAIANLVILRFDCARETRVLTGEERWLRRTLKHLVLGLSSLERAIARQRSRMIWLQEGDANTKLFHLVANGRKLKSFIPAISVAGTTITDQAAKEEAFFEAYSDLLGSCGSREHTLDLDYLGIEPIDLDDQDLVFQEEETWKVVRDMPSDRAPGPDGFIGVLFQCAWAIVKGDVMAALNKLFLNNGRGFGRLNQALITLIPKKPEACHINDFRTICLVHSIPKLASKLLASRICPCMGELEALRLFGEASGLKVNFAKSLAVMIRSEEVEEELVRQALPWKLETFPIRYLGLQLGIKQLTRSEWQPIVHNVLKMMPGWQRGLVTRPGRLILVNQVVRARPTHHLIMVKAPKWALERVDKGCRAFFWAGSEEIQGGKCAVAWCRVCRPKQLGGLGLVDLYKQGIALRLRWEWLKRTDSSRPWQGLNYCTDKQVMMAFDSLVKWEVGEGSRVLFWRDRWINGACVKEIAPLLVKKVRQQVVNRRKVKEVMHLHAWTQDIVGEMNTKDLLQFIQLWEVLVHMELVPDTKDTPIWQWDASDMYSAKSAYKMMCEGGVRFQCASAI